MSETNRRPICADRLHTLLRYGRKQSGCWDECEHPPEMYCEIYKDGEEVDIIQAMEAHDALVDVLTRVRDRLECAGSVDNCSALADDVCAALKAAGVGT